MAQNVADIAECQYPDESGWRPVTRDFMVQTFVFAECQYRER